jgi:hypothetical protein
VRSDPVHAAWLAAIALGSAAMLAACGASTSNGAGTGTTAASANPGLQYANCMRSHGVTSFPDPGSGGGRIQKIGPGTGIDPQSPAFQAAEKACGRFGPKIGGPTHMSASDQRRALAFAECVRAHGVPSFPDPSESAPADATAVISLKGMVFAFTSDFDLRSPAFQRAAGQCGVRLPKFGGG